MRTEFSNQEGSQIVDRIIATIQRNKEYLSEVDSHGGDGDHGINMNKGFTFARQELDELPSYTMSDGLKVISHVLVNKIGGSMGPLYGSFFRGLSVASRKSETITNELMLEMLKKAYKNLSDLTDAKVGDKSLIDVLAPTVETYEKTLNAGDSFNECLSQSLTAAQLGLEATKEIPAKIGRASRIGDRSIGFQDAGATSCYLIIEAMVNTINELFEE
ncbi:dihydroxyacetone kinase subunit DhaL [Enterococcus hulanensis]|uniref:Dihydroxyacetone kinase subunit DhaL n=1 Tax=Enterococcus hulanensis TaxID=2559929 RepID=A0ABU3F2G3_9ENTE|nr:dihydroxyacetone kinase subunit DhaL [Enterococcus hulanensis]MDT2601304.1 dihydroxyacetone kinase subunit DhaL [Enterococcus hulanensis]MDT2610786.1 dihydroxyacetone kinase subunit DhaL [Enterococcus hulanensis]MDT2618191.1 dihydroxyacetone kinase subunit DhaL [Enterococcus hulanensis]MDT2629239.1 dihydroxyacetone kinase subunit DhaL [Enterococcus hulanensis]MDT2656756.1 dihydroxyacetone kinase subunit DhaL [Enterococcus hulanensis]